jgi:hypothetical protein
MNTLPVVVEIRFTDGSRPTKAHADVRLDLPGGSITVRGMAVIVMDGKAPWVAFPKRPGNTPGKYFPVITADGEINTAITEAVLTAYHKARAA